MSGCEKRLATCNWSAARMLMAKYGACRRLERFGERSDRLHSTSGGDSDTELNELHVKPIGVPLGPAVVTTLTPVAKVPRALRKSRGSKNSSPGVLAAISQSRRIGGDAEHELAGGGRGHVPRERVMALRGVDVPERALHNLLVVEKFAAARFEKPVDGACAKQRGIRSVTPQS